MSCEVSRKRKEVDAVEEEPSTPTSVEDTGDKASSRSSKTLLTGVLASTMDRPRRACRDRKRKTYQEEFWSEKQVNMLMEDKDLARMVKKEERAVKKAQKAFDSQMSEVEALRNKLVAADEENPAYAQVARALEWAEANLKTLEAPLQAARARLEKVQDEKEKAEAWALEESIPEDEGSVGGESEDEEFSLDDEMEEEEADLSDMGSVVDEAELAEEEAEAEAAAAAEEEEMSDIANSDDLEDEDDDEDEDEDISDDDIDDDDL